MSKPMSSVPFTKPIYFPKPIYDDKESTNIDGAFEQNSFPHQDATTDSAGNDELPSIPNSKDKKAKKAKGKSFKFGWGKKKNKSHDKLIEDNFPEEDPDASASNGTGGDNSSSYFNGLAFDAATSDAKDEYGGFGDDEQTTSVVQGANGSVAIESEKNDDGVESPYGKITTLGTTSQPQVDEDTYGDVDHHQDEEENEGAYGEIKPFETARSSSSLASKTSSLNSSSLTFHHKEQESLYTEMAPDEDVVAEEQRIDALTRQKRELLARSKQKGNLSASPKKGGVWNNPVFTNKSKSPDQIQARNLPAVPTANGERGIKGKGGISRNLGRRGTMAPNAMKKAQVRGTKGADDEVSDIAKGYVGAMDHLTVQDYVLGSMPGDYLVRNSSSSSNLVLCVNDRRRLANYKIEAMSAGEFKFYGRPFSDLDAAIKYAHEHLMSLVKPNERLEMQNPATVENWFVGETEKARVEDAVASGQHGQFLVRKSSSFTSFVVCVNDQGSIGNFLINVDTQTGGYLFGNFKFKSLRKTIGWFKSSPIKGPKTHQLTITTPVALEWTNIDQLDDFDL